MLVRMAVRLRVAERCATQQERDVGADFVGRDDHSGQRVGPDRGHPRDMLERETREGAPQLRSNRVGVGVIARDTSVAHRRGRSLRAVGKVVVKVGRVHRGRQGRLERCLPPFPGWRNPRWVAQRELGGAKSQRSAVDTCDGSVAAQGGGAKGEAYLILSQLIPLHALETCMSLHLGQRRNANSLVGEQAVHPPTPQMMALAFNTAATSAVCASPASLMSTRFRYNHGRTG